MDTPDFEHGRVYFKQFGAERVKLFILSGMWDVSGVNVSIFYMTVK